MSVPVSNDVVGVLDYAESVLKIYLQDELDARNAARSLSMVAPADADYRRSEIFNAPPRGTEIRLLCERVETTETNDRTKRKIHIVAICVFSAKTQTAASEREMADTVYSFSEAVEIVLRSYMRARPDGSTEAGVYSCRTRQADIPPPYKLQGSAAYIFTSQVRAVVHQESRLLRS